MISSNTCARDSLILGNSSRITSYNVCYTKLLRAELAAAPAIAKDKAIPCTGMAGYHFMMTVSALDCTGCGSCINVCPGKKGNKALAYMPLETQLAEQELFNYAQSLAEKPEVAEKFKETTVKGSQFKQPLLEFSGACAGCGETYSNDITRSGKTGQMARRYRTP